MIAQVAELLYAHGSVSCSLLIDMMVQIQFGALRINENSYH